MTTKMHNKDTARALAIACVVALTTVALVEPAAAAQAFGKLESILGQITSALTGAVGKALATIGVMIVGIMWIFGQMDFRRAGAVILGIAVIFGAAEIVNTMAG